eukprot:3589565-Pleurochrysis_carterae.AAC.1
MRLHPRDRNAKTRTKQRSMQEWTAARPFCRSDTPHAKKARRCALLAVTCATPCRPRARSSAGRSFGTTMAHESSPSLILCEPLDFSDCASGLTAPRLSVASAALVAWMPSTTLTEATPMP